MELQSYFSHVDEAAAWLRERVAIEPRVAVVLSGGLHPFADGLEGRKEIPSAQIPHFPRALAEGHAGKLVFGRHGGIPLVALAGRFHYYEGHAPQAVVFPQFVLARLGAKTLITTNAVGGVSRSFKPGDIMVVEDHINLMGTNPLIGLAFQRPRDQFTSLTEAYDGGLRLLAGRVAKRLGIELKAGIYCATSGPSYETKAEVRAIRKMGADAVGMSTVPEIIAANFLGMNCLAFSCVANAAADLHGGTMTHTEVLAAMEAMAPRMVALLGAVIEQIGREA